MIQSWALFQNAQVDQGQAAARWPIPRPMLGPVALSRSTSTPKAIASV